MPDTVHGYAIHAQFKTAGGDGLLPGRVILVDRGVKSYERWVSSWMADGADEWSQGHYFSGFLAAFDHFVARCKTETP